MNDKIMSTLNAKPSIVRESVHPSITTEQVSDLVDTFYQRIQAHENLGPIFETQKTSSWDVHMEKMKTFWRSVLMRTGEYSGKPVPVHQKMSGIGTDEFKEWLALFSMTSREVFEADASVHAEEAARRIATSLWLSRSTDPFRNPPDWSQ